jgi:alpha-glucosidase
MENNEPVVEPEQKEPLPVAPESPREIAFGDADVSTRYDDVYQIVVPDEIVEVRWQNGAYEFECQNGICLRLQVVAQGIVRLRYSPDGVFQADFSYALDPNGTLEKVTATLTESANEYVLVCDPLQVVIAKTGARVRFYNLDDRLLHEDEAGYSAKRTIRKGWCELKISKKHQRKEVFFGLGRQNLQPRPEQAKPLKTGAPMPSDLAGIPTRFTAQCRFIMV